MDTSTDSPIPTGSGTSRLPVGSAKVLPDGGEDHTLTVPVANGWITGRAGSGKTMFVHALITALAHTDDTLVWLADQYGGSAAPWVDGVCRTGADGTGLVAVGAVDWVVDTTDGVKKMLTRATDVVRSRRTTFRGEILRAGIDTGVQRLPVSPDRPAIVVVFDGVDWEADPDLEALLRDLLRFGPEASVHAVVAQQPAAAPAGLRGNVEWVASLVDGRGDDYLTKALGLDAAQKLRDFVADASPGAVVIHNGSGGWVGAGTVDRTPPSQIAYTVRDTEARRPLLDDTSAHAAGDEYRKRWTLHSDGGAMLTLLRDSRTDR